MEILFKLNNGKIANVDTKGDSVIDDARFAALTRAIEEKAEAWKNFVNVDQIKITM